MAVVVQYAHQPASGAASRCSTPTKLPIYEPLCLPDYVPRTSPSVEYIFAKHEDSLYSHDARTLDGERPASTTSAINASNRRPKSKANHAKLHRKRGPNPSSNYTTSRPKPKNKAGANDESSVLSSLPETSSFESSPRPAPSSRSPTRERLRNNLRRFSVQKELEDLSLDLSLTAEENAERLGLAIRACDPGSPLLGTSTSSSPYKVQHGRSRSNGSQVSLTSGLFTPTAPYSFNMQHTAQPYAPPTSYSLDVEISPSTVTLDEMPAEAKSSDAIKEEAEGEECTVNDVEDEEGSRPSLLLNRPSSSTTKTESASCSPPSLSKATTLDSRSCITPSTSDLSFRLRSLSRRSTDVSSEVGTPRSVSSFSFRPKIREENIDPVKRAASIAAARRAFAEREEEKTRKYEDRLKKASEKRKHTWPSSRKQSLDNMSSSSSSSPSRSASIDAGNDGLMLYGREYSQLTPVPSHALPTTVSTINHVAIRRTKKKSSSAPASARKSSGSRRAAKGIYVRSFLWLKMRMLNLARQSKSDKKSSAASSSSSSPAATTTTSTATTTTTATVVTPSRSSSSNSSPSQRRRR